MELVYLWVEEYKNIKNQGFNFSPRFECKFYDEYETDENGKEKLKDNCKLEVKPKEYTSIFPPNINVTAIVGENGSGKSSVLELISEIGNYENPITSDYPISFLELTQITLYYNKFKNKLYIYKKNLTVIINNKSSITVEEIASESIQKILIKPTPSHSQQEYLLLLDFLKNNNHIVFPFELPEIISFGIHDDFYDLLKLIENNSFDFYTYYTPFEKNQDNRLKIFHILLLLAYLKNYEIDFKILASENYDDTILELEKKIDTEIKSKIRSFIQVPLEDFSRITDHYVNMKKIPNDFFKIYIEIIKRKNKDDFLPFKGKNVFNFDLYPKMSDGQYQLTYIFNTIYSQINQDKIMLCIDEGENYLHPNWQKKYINYLYQFLKDNFSDKKIHLIVSTHSPFLLSDLPKENIIFLDTYKAEDNEVKSGVQKAGNCKVLKHDEVLKKKETFGANIHTLLSDGFFMSDGLMGEFAKGKIEEVIQLLKSKRKLSKKNQKFCKSIIDIIDEPFLKEKLLHMYNAKYQTNEEKISDLKEQIKRLENGQN